MTRHYATKHFFRQMPNELLGRYFQTKDVLKDVDFAALPKKKPDKLFAAWLKLPDTQRNAMDAELHEIFALCCEKGVIAILDEAEWQLRESPEALSALVEKLSALPGHFERAMVTFLDHPAFWQGACLFCHADTLGFWRKRNNIPQKHARTDPKSRKDLAHQISTYFHHTEGRGQNCVVEAYRRGERDYFFCYPEDHAQQGIEWVNGECARRPHNPAFEIVYVYAQKEGSLDLSFRGSSKAVGPLQAMFALSILNVEELLPDSRDTRVYDLEPLRKRSFRFSYPVDSGIQRVAVKKLRLSSRIKQGERLTLEADTEENAEAIYDLLDQVKKSPEFRLYNYHVTQVELVACVALRVDKPPKTFPIRLTYPNSCSLKYDDIGLKLRDMLQCSGIEPKQPESAPSDA